ncbi:hypothetical protein D9758_008794 [Tetrapyrgos nigripes]|uniref:Uncharacterized protein n=1 Tax=Tetrapyrgos nigripes TaxID=182062 RepID=A0A8H5D5F7_9AGAR|nr:hypothetical protein D9758_008794 [Tetrapyrgos nigripes]
MSSPETILSQSVPSSPPAAEPQASPSPSDPPSTVVSENSESASSSPAPMTSILSSLRSGSLLKSPGSASSTMSSFLGSLSSSIAPLSASVSNHVVSMTNGVWSYAEHYAQGWTNAQGENMSAKQVEETILVLIRELVNGQKYSDLNAVQDILASCDEGCRRYSLSLSDLLQRKSIEGHTPFYWVIVHHRPSFSRNAGALGAGTADEKVNESTQISVMDMTTSFLKYASPLTRSTISDILQACLILRDQEFFRQLRVLPQITSSHMSGSDLLLLGPKTLPDDIQVRELEESDGNGNGIGIESGEGVLAFEVKFKIPQFQKRMMVSQKVQMEFIAMGRLWCIQFFVSPDNVNWALGIQTMEQSPPTFVDATLTIPQVRFTSSTLSSADTTPGSDEPPKQPSDTLLARALSTKIQLNADKQLVSMDQATKREDQTHSVYGVVDDGSSSSSLQQT